MIPYKPNRLTAVPRTLEVRLEIMKAIRTLTAQDDGGLIRQRGADIAGLRSYVQKFDPNEPRVSAGTSDGGQWTSEGAIETLIRLIRLLSWQLAAGNLKQSVTPS